MFKKVFIADSLAPEVNQIFANYQDLNGGVLMLGAIYFGFQIYCDFSGYSDIAIGTAKLFGFDLMSNFKFPYFSRNIGEFWRRWHISLSTWFRDYVYVPLGGSQGGTCRTIRNVFLVFLISGLWHGANWTFVLWGLINAILFLPLILLGINRTHLDTVAKGAFFPPFRDLCQIIATFFVTTLAWIVFRAESVSHAIRYICGIFDSSLFSVPEVFPKKLIMAILLFVSWEWLQRERHHALDFRHMRLPVGVRWGFYYALVVLVLAFGGPRESFIYFQF